MGGDELEFVDWLCRRQPDHPRVALGIGDDMAVVRSAADRFLVSCDLLLDGVHFDSTRQSLKRVGRKCIACSLSDCAAMAVRPLAATVSVGLPQDMPLSAARELHEGMLSIAAEYDLAIAGGDTTRWDHPLVVDVAITAEPYPLVEPVRRSGAGPGDRLYVSGPLGGSLLGRHLEFTPRVREAKAIATALGDRLHAMIDISDGLALDLWRLCQASRVGAVLEERLLGDVVSDDASRSAEADGRTALDHALSDGEDYELLLAVAGEPAAIAGVTLFPVGRIVPSGLRLESRDGTLAVLEPRGYVH